MALEYGIVAGIDVHKKWLYVVIGPEGVAETEFRRMRVGSTTRDLQQLADELRAAGVRTVVMESTAKYWRPVWAALEGAFQLYLAQARSNAATHGRKTDYGDAARLVKRLRTDDLKLSYVPDMEQRDWRLLTRTRVEYQRDITRLRNRLETLLEEGCIKLSGYLSDLFGSSGRRILRKLAEGEDDAQRLASLADPKVKASQKQLAEALQGHLSPTQRLVLRQALDEVASLERQTAELDAQLAEAMKPHLEVIRRLCAIPGIGVLAAREIIAELGPDAVKFASAANAASWVGVCPGRHESAGKSDDDSSAKGNRYLRRVLAQSAWAAARNNGCQAQDLFRRLTPRLGTNKAIWAVAHYLLRVIWVVLHNGVEYQERGPLVNPVEKLKRRLESNARALRRYGFNVQVTIPETEAV
jgi:transposase